VVQTSHSEDEVRQIVLRVLPLVKDPVHLSRLLTRVLMHQAELQIHVDNLERRIKALEEA